MVKKAFKRAIGKIHDVPESSTPVVYQKTGDQGNRPSTKKVRLSGMKHFNNFIHSKHMKLSDVISEPDLIIDVLQEFATFLSEAKLGFLNNYLSNGTALQYLSTAKEFLRQATSNIVLWSKDDVWYDKIRTAMTARIVKRCIDNCMAISDKAAPLPRPDMITVTKYLAKKVSASPDLEAVKIQLVEPQR